MRFVSEHTNPLPDLVELKNKITPKKDEGNNYQILAELRIHPYEIDDKIGTIKVEICEATLSVEFFGVEVVANTKLGQPTLPQVIRREVQVEETSTASSDREKSAKLSGSAGASSTSTSAKLDVSLDAKAEATEKSGKSVVIKASRSDASEFYRVRAIGDDKWRIAEEKRATLDGVYVDYSPICEITPIPGKNRFGVEVNLIVKQRHVKAKLIQEQTWKQLLPTNNQQKIAAVLIAKSLHAST